MGFQNSFIPLKYYSNNIVIDKEILMDLFPKQIVNYP
jgi:hypothetical protein